MKKDVLLITHAFDTNCLFLTAPIIFENKQNYPEFKNVILETLMEKLQMHSESEPESVTQEMNCTNRYSWGKIFVQVQKITNFPYYNSVFVRLSVQPWSLNTKRIMDNKYDFYQGFYIPVANHFFTLKIELINMESVGLFRESFKEHVLDSYEVRLPDLNKEPFKSDGTLFLPIRPIQDYKKYGLKLAEDI